MSEELKMKFYSNRSPKKGYSWETPPEPIAEADIAETVTTEVLILGGGISGLASGARCADMGLQVIVLDKNKNLFALAGQIAAVNSRIMEREGVPPVDKKILAADWMKMSGSRVQEELLWIFINRSAEGFHWMLDLAGEENLDVGVYEAYKGPVFQEYPCTHHIFQKKDVHKYKQWWGGWLACDILQTELLDQGGQVIRDTTALYLEKDETGRVTGCVAKCSDGAYRRYQGTKAVVVACGDCCENEEMLEAFCPIGARTKDRYARPGNTGDGQKMLYWAGAAIDNMEWAPTIHTLSGTGYQGFFLHVNQQGNRFMNEDTWMQAKSVRVLMQPGGEWAYSILDSKFADEIGERFGELGGQGMMPLSLVGESYDRAKMVETVEKWIENGTAFVADTIEELAEKIGVPAENLKATVDRYNEIVASGDDTDFGKRSRLLTSVEQGPFYALKWGPKLLDVFGGALVNKNLNVIDPDAQPIPGLYAVGNCAGGMYHVDYPLLLNGNSYGRALAYACQLGDVLTGKL